MGVFIAPATLEQIRAASDIVDIIGAAIPLKRNGANFVALCPFHKEKSPSFNVNPHKQIFHCFGCHKGGDVFTFIKEYESIDFPDAVRRLAERAHIVIEKTADPAQAQGRHIKDQLLQIHQDITQRWQTALATDPAGQIARDYLAKRGVSAEAVELFRLGYAPDLWDDTVNWAKSRRLDFGLMEQSGLVVRKEDSYHFYDRFRGRLIFPICDEQGRVIGFSGRVLSGDEKTAKYVNSPESPIFTKGKVMFGLDKSKRDLLDKGAALICEGQLDLIACFMAGVRNVVAPQGTALTADHTRILKRYVEEVVLCFDSDNAGQNAAVRSFDSLLASGLAVRVASIPAPHDPDSYIKEFGGPAFADLIARARSFFDYYLDRLCVTHSPETDRGRQAIVQEMSEAVHKTGSAVLFDTYAQKTAQRLSVSADSVRAAFKKTGRAAPPRAEDSAGPDPAPEIAAPRPPDNECWLLRLTLENDDFIEWIAAHLDLDWLTHPGVRAIMADRLEAHAADSWRGVAAWLSAASQEDWKSLVTEILADNRPITEPAAVLKGAGARDGTLKRLRDKYLDLQLVAANQRLALPDLSEAEQTALVLQMQSLRLQKKQPLSPRADEV
ncbi:MAG TPA: DNA primase [Verrucomicrobiae bacterium]|jgi:DNA primase|nr:DNA primase [Verrucomicrobiae bacterium]